MTDDAVNDQDEAPDRDKLRAELEAALRGGGGSKFARFTLSAVSGAIPFAGGILGGASDAWSESEQARINDILASWLKLQEDEIKEIAVTMAEILQRLDLNDDKIDERLRSPEYLSLVKKCFRDWAAAESEEKRKLVRNLLSNAAATKICSDDVIRLFIEWIAQYSETHFRVIREIYKAPGSTRYGIWREIYGETTREDSAEADLFKLIIRDLSTGQVVRQRRATDGYGNFIKEKPARRRKGAASPYLKSAFDNEKPYVLTELGGWFVSYTMNEIVPRLGAKETGAE